MGVSCEKGLFVDWFQSATVIALVSVGTALELIEPPLKIQLDGISRSYHLPQVLVVSVSELLLVQQG